MKITFLKSWSKKDQYLYLYGNAEQKYEYYRIIIPELENILKEKFPSIRFINKENEMFRYFHFKNKADEAHFLLWSSEKTMDFK